MPNQPLSRYAGFFNVVGVCLLLASYDMREVHPIACYYIGMIGGFILMLPSLLED